MKTTKFNFKRFNLLVKKDLIFNSKLYTLQLLAIFTVITLISYIIFSYFQSAPINEIIGSRFQVLIPTYLIFMIIFSFNIFKFYTSKIKTQNYITSPNSQIEKLCYEFLKIIIALLVYPLLFAMAFKLGYQIKSIEWNGATNYPSFIDLLYECFSVKTTTELIKNITIIASSAFFFSIIYMLGNLFFRKYRLIKTTIIIAIVCFIIFLIKIVLDKNGVQYNSTILNISKSNYLFIITLVVLKSLIYLRFKKIQA